MNLGGADPTRRAAQLATSAPPLRGLSRPTWASSSSLHRFRVAAAWFALLV
jgi:hypothetical protein